MSRVVPMYEAAYQTRLYNVAERDHRAQFQTLKDVGDFLNKEPEGKTLLVRVGEMLRKLKDIGTDLLLLILVATSLVGALVTWRYAIETKGISLEKIEEKGLAPKRNK